MNKIKISIILFLAALVASCSDDLPTASADLWQVEKVEAVTGDGQASVTWIPSGKREVHDYLVSWTAGTAGVDGGSETVDASTTSLLLENLENDVTYTVSVQANYADGLSGKVSATVIPKSTRFDVTDFYALAGTEKVRLEWKKPLSNNLKGYTISVNPGGKSFEVNDPATEKYMVEGLTNDTEYTFTLIANYTNGASDGVTTTATPGMVSPATVQPAEIIVNQAVRFTANDMYFMKDEIIAATWTFGDGTLSNELSPMYQYAAAGSYTVEVTVTYADQSTESGSMEITVGNFTWESFGLVEGEAFGYVKVSSTVFSPDGTKAYIPTSSPNGHLFAFDVWSGKKSWMYPISTVTYGGGCVVDDNGNIYQCGTDKKVYSLDDKGNERWVLDVDGVMGAFPAVTSDGVLYCLTNGSTLYAIDANSGKEKWNQKLQGGTGSAVAVDASGNVYAGTYEGVFAFAQDGTTLWSAPGLAVTERGAFAIQNGVLYAALRGKAGVAAIDMSNGTKKWQYATAGGDCYLPVTDTEGTVYFTEKGSQTVFAVTASGTLKWSKNVGCNLTYTGIALAQNGNLYFGTQGKHSDGNYKIIGLSAADGSEQFSQNCDQQIMSAATIGPDNRLYIGTIGSSAAVPGRVLAIDIQSGIAKGAWSVRGGNLQGTNSLK